MRAHPGRFLVQTAFIVLLSTATVSAAWVDGTSNPRFNPSGGASYPSVLYNSGHFSGYGAPYLYKLWYTSRTPSGIALAASNDGTNWTLLSIPEPG